MLSQEEIFSIEYERLRSVYQHAPLIVVVGIVNALLATTVIAPNHVSWAPMTWLGSVVALSIARIVLARVFLRRSERPRTSLWRWVAVGGALLNGLLWGGAAFMIVPAPEAVQLFFALVIAGMSAGAATTSASSAPCAMAFILPACLPLAARFLSQGSIWVVSGVMVLIFVGALGLVSTRAHRNFGEQIALRNALRREQARLENEIAQRQAAEATLFQSQKMEAIGHLTGGIAHDFNNLLQAVVGNLGLIDRAAGNNPKIAGFIRTAEQAAMRGSELTASLLSFARQQPLEPARIDVNALLRQFEPILVRSFDATVRFRLALTEPLPGCLGDPTHFQSAVLNLVINARDAMPDGGVLTVSTAAGVLTTADLAGNEDATPGMFVGVTVQDTGTGMAPEVLARVFEPFFTTKDVGKGTGLGLSQVFGFARQSAGHIVLRSTPGQGTEATLWLPAGEVDAAEASMRDPS